MTKNTASDDALKTLQIRNDKHTSLFIKRYNQLEKSFVNCKPGVNIVKVFCP
jgi:hypothetical protein